MLFITDSKIFTKLNLKPLVLDIALEQSNNMVTPTQLGLTYIAFKESKQYRLFTPAIVRLIENGTIQMFYDPKYPNIAPFIPFVSKKIPGKECVAVNIAHHVDKNGVDEDVVGGNKVVTYNIQLDKLVALLFGAMSVLVGASSECFRNNAQARDSIILLASHMWLKALSHKSSIATNPTNASHFRYVFTKWVCSHIFRMQDSDMIKGIAAKTSAMKDRDRAHAFDIRFSDEELSGYDVDEFILNVLRPEIPQLAKLDLPTVESGFINMGTINLMAIDYLPYMVSIAVAYNNDYKLYGNTYLKRELNQEIKDCWISIAEQYGKRSGLLASLK